jgi:hypothetical protein
LDSGDEAHDIEITLAVICQTLTIFSLSLSPETETTMALCAPTHNLSLIPSKSHARTRRARRSRLSGVVQIVAVYDVAGRKGGQEAAPYEEGQLDRPKWVGATPLSRLVGALISFKPLYSLLKLGARQVLIRFFMFC